jgi:DNA-binding CsgD family transcriptional regulator
MNGCTGATLSEQRLTRVSRREVDAQLFAAAAAATAALEQLNQGVALIDRAYRVSYANSLANAICGESDGLSIRAGGLIAMTKPDSARLSLSIKRAVDSSQGTSLRLQRPSRRRPLSVLVTPLQLPAGFSTAPAALVVINDPERSPVPPRERLMQAYGFTGAEAGVAQLLLRGNDVTAVARCLNIHLETARTHLRRLLVKTGTHRQSDLILVLVREVGTIV